MMDKLLTVDDVAGILRVSRRTAYNYMGQMIHMTQPLRVTETSLRQWISGRTVDPEEQHSRKGKNKAPKKGAELPGLREYHIPRRRAEG